MAPIQEPKDLYEKRMVAEADDFAQHMQRMLPIGSDGKLVRASEPSRLAQLLNAK